MVTPLPKKIVPVIIEDNHESGAAVPRVTPEHDKEVQIIPLEETQDEIVRSVPDSPKRKNIISVEEDVWDKTQAYILKYNTRSSPRYAFATAILKIRQHPQICNHVLYPTTGTACFYIKLITGAVLGQSARV